MRKLTPTEKMKVIDRLISALYNVHNNHVYLLKYEIGELHDLLKNIEAEK